MNAPRAIRTWVIEDNTLFRKELVSSIDAAEDIVCEEDFGDAELLEAYVDTVAEDALPDVLLMDIRLPGKSGIESTRLLKQRFPDLSIVMLTQDAEPDTIYEALKAGANGYLLKSMAFEETLLAIRQAAKGAMLAPAPVALRMWQHFNTLTGKDDYPLTPREIEVLKKMCDGLTQSEIGDALFISPNTVSQHVKSIYYKLQVNTRAGAVAKALRERIVE